jgi:hypothetical protein
MFWSSRVMCEVCNVSVPKAQAKRTLERGFRAVCRTCYERWNRGGRLCAKCRAPVAGPQLVGLFADAHALGHADCGGALLAA